MSGLWLVLAAMLVLAACSKEPATQAASEDTDSIRRLAQFADPQQNRVLVFAFTQGTSVDAVREHAEGLSFMPERLLAVYYIVEGSTTVGSFQLAQSISIMRAMDLMFEESDIDPWHYAFMRPFVGEPAFYDCIETPDAILCR